MKHFKSRWPTVSYENIVRHYGAAPVIVPQPRAKTPYALQANALQDEIYKWLNEQEIQGTFIGTVPGAQCWHIEGESNRLMFQLRWA